MFLQVLLTIIMGFGENDVLGPKNIDNIIIILLKQDYKVQLANNKIQVAWLTSWLVVW